MDCYRLNCQEKCNDLKKMYCIYKINKEQHKVIAKIRGNYCENCGSRMIRSKYMGKATKLCTACGIVTRGQEIISYCLVNSKRAG